MVDRLVVSSIRLAFKVATPEKNTVIVLFNKKQGCHKSENLF